MSGLVYSRNGTVYSRDNPPLPRKDFNFTEAQKSEYKDKLYTLRKMPQISYVAQALVMIV